jgi:MFS family permease
MLTAPGRSTALLLNIAHALDHMFLLIFATAVVSIATAFGVDRWEDLMPYGVGAFLLFGLGALPAGRLGDLWGRRRMMLIFYYGLGASALLVAMTQNAWQLAAALTLLGAFASIYHPVGIPMLVRGTQRPGFTIGVNGLSGNLGVAVAAITTGLLVKYIGWRAAFALPALVSIGCGILFARVAPEETAPPARGKAPPSEHSAGTIARIFTIMTVAAVSASLLFNFATNGNGELLRERLVGIVEDPAALGALLAGVYVVAAFAQVVVGLLIDRFPMKYLFIGIVALQAPLFYFAATATGWTLFALQLGFMIVIFGAIPFTDAMIVRYIDDRMRSRVSGMRLFVSLSVSSAAVWALGPVVKAGGFEMLLIAMSIIALATLCTVALLPASSRPPRPNPNPTGITPIGEPTRSPRAAD